MNTKTAVIENNREPLRQELWSAAQTGDGVRFRRAMHGIAATGLSASTYSFVAARLRELGARGAESAGLKHQRTFIARSVTIETMVPQICVEAALAGLYLEIQVGSYGGFIDDLTNHAGALAQFAPQLVLLVTDIEDLAGSLPSVCAAGVSSDIEAETEKASARISEMLRVLRTFSTARVAAQGFLLPDAPALSDVGDANALSGESRAVRRINDAIASVCREIGGAVFFDQDLLAARHGRARWRDPRMFLSTRMGVSAAFLAEYAKGLVRAVRTLYFPPRKVLCTDLDDTLWGGVVGEEGAQGISTGHSFPGNCYREYQNYLKRLAARGVLLAIVSKNNPSDVDEIWKRRAADLAVSADDFVAAKVGWGDKVESLRQLAKELSLGLDSFVFVDDSPLECAAVRQRLPQVMVVQLSREQPWNHARTLAAVGAFDALSITDEDRSRTSEYRAEKQRADMETHSASREDFLSSLHIVCRAIDVRHAPIVRAAQLLNKTNQFNLTTRRYSSVEIEKFAASPNWITCALRVRDRIGESGVVAIAMLEKKDNVARIDTFLLSCRAIGRGIEGALLWHVAMRARSEGLGRLIGEFISTEKNQLCADFYGSHGFRAMPLASVSAERPMFCYSLDLNTLIPDKPWWITFEEDNDYDFTNRPGIAANHHRGPVRYIAGSRVAGSHGGQR